MDWITDEIPFDQTNTIGNIMPNNSKANFPKAFFIIVYMYLDAFNFDVFNLSDIS